MKFNAPKLHLGYEGHHSAGLSISFDLLETFITHAKNLHTQVFSLFASTGKSSHCGRESNPHPWAKQHNSTYNSALF